MLWSPSSSHFFMATCVVQVSIISTWITAVVWPPTATLAPSNPNLLCGQSNLFEMDIESGHFLLGSLQWLLWVCSKLWPIGSTRSHHAYLSNTRHATLLLTPYTLVTVPLSCFCLGYVSPRTPFFSCLFNSLLQKRNKQFPLEHTLRAPHDFSTLHFCLDVQAHLCDDFLKSLSSARPYSLLQVRG